MLNTENVFLSLISDGHSYEARKGIALTFLANRDKSAALAAMTKQIGLMILRRPKDFEAADKQKNLCSLAADRALTYGLEEFENEALPGSLSATKSPTIPVRKIEPMVLEVLRKCRVQGCLVYLPSGQLDRKLYENVNAVLTAMGGKWTAGKTQAHVFAGVEPDAFSACYDELRTTGIYTDPKDLGFFETSPELAAQVVKIAGLHKGMRVMEPSAGRGRIALAAAEIVGIGNVACVEVFSPNVKALKQHGLQVLEQDFLSLEPPTNDAEKYDVVLMNPPFGNMQDVAHVTHACKFLKLTGRLVAITSPSWEGRSNHRKAETFQQLIADSQADVISVEAGAFKASGTMVTTRIIALDAENLPWNRCEALEEELMEAPVA